MNKITKNSSWMIIDQIIRLISSLVVGIWIARYLGPNDFGLYSYVLVFSSFFAILSKLGLDSNVIKALIQKPFATKNILIFSICTRLTVGIAIIIISFYFYMSVENIESKYIFIASLGLIFQATEIFELHFYAQSTLKRVALSRITHTLLSSTIKIYLITKNHDLIFFIMLISVDWLVFSIILYFFSKKEIKKTSIKKEKFSGKIILIKHSIPLMLSNFLFIAYTRIDQLMINNMLGNYSGGIYASVIRISEIWIFIPATISMILFPILFEKRKKSQNSYLSALQTTYTIFTWMALFISIIIFSLNDEIINLLYGENFKSGAEALLLSTWLCLFFFISILTTKHLNLENLYYNMLVRNLGGITINIALNFFLIQTHGIEGAIFSTMASLFLATYVFDLFAPSSRHFLMLKINAFFIKIK